MAKAATARTEHLERHGNRWRVTVAVPRELHSILGSRLKRSLPTDSLAEANRLKKPVVDEFRYMIANASAGRHKDDLAEEFRRALQVARRPDDREVVLDHIHITAEQLRGPATGEAQDPDTGEVVEVFDPAKERTAHQFLRLAQGKATPIDQRHGEYLGQLTVKPRTKADDVRALALLKQWCESEGVEPYLQEFPSRRMAMRFCDGLPKLRPDLSPVTLNKYLVRLSVYWAWLLKREEVEQNIWFGVKLPEPERGEEDKERPFTEVELLRLLNGPASQAMQDLMRIGALTGCRLDPIVCLRVKDCRPDGVFVFKPQKQEKKSRLCPIHPDLKEIVARRCEGKAPDDSIFPEWPPVKKAGSLRERSFKASGHFMDYRRSVEVADEREGRRRSLVNFHSFRRWFITKAEQAGHHDSLIAAAVGHKRQGITLGVYSAGPLLEQVRAVVESVRLPPAARASDPTSHMP